MVTPLAFNAAMPVGAKITNRLCVFCARSLRKVVFPVPAFPVRKMLLFVLFTNLAAVAMRSVISMA